MKRGQGLGECHGLNIGSQYLYEHKVPELDIENDHLYLVHKGFDLIDGGVENRIRLLSVELPDIAGRLRGYLQTAFPQAQDFFDLCFTEGLKDPLIFGAVSDSLFWFNLQQGVLSKMVNYLSIDNNNVVW